MKPRPIPATEFITTPRRRARHGLLIGLFATLGLWLPSGSALPAWAQGLNVRSEGLPFGHFLVFPSVTFDYTQDDNVFYANDAVASNGRIASGVMLIKPRILIDLPRGDNHLRLAYAPAYRDYTSDRFVQSEHWSHYFDLEGAVRLGPAVNVAIRDHLVRGTTELQQVDAGGELNFGLVPFTAHEPSADLELSFGSRQSLSVHPRYSEISFDNSASAAFVRTQQHELQGRYNYKLSPMSTFYGYYSFATYDQERREDFFNNNGYTTRNVGLGVRRTVNKAVVAVFSGGYATLNTDRVGGTNFGGLMADVNATWQLSDASKLEIQAHREPYQSFFVNSNYYINNQIGLRLVNQIGRTLYWVVGATYRYNLYPEPVDIAVTPGSDPSLDLNKDGRFDAFESYQPSVGTRRHDRNLQSELGMGYQAGPSLRYFLGYNFEERRSNIEQDAGGRVSSAFDYNINRVVFRMEVGWM